MTSATDSVASDRAAGALGSPGKTYTFLVVALATFLAALAIWKIPAFAVVSEAVLEFRVAAAGKSGDGAASPTITANLPTHEELVAQVVAESQLREAIYRSQKYKAGAEPLDEAKVAERIQELRQRIRVEPKKNAAANVVELRVEYMGHHRADALSMLQSLADQNLATLHGRPLDSRLQAEFVRAMEKEQRTRHSEEQAFRDHEQFLAKHFNELKKLDRPTPKSAPLVEKKTERKKTEEKEKPAKAGTPAVGIQVSKPTGPAMVANPHASTPPATDKPATTPTAIAIPGWSPPDALLPEINEAAAPAVAPTAPPIAAPVTPAPSEPFAPPAPTTPAQPGFEWPAAAPETMPPAANAPAAPPENAAPPAIAAPPAVDTSAIEQTIRALEARIAELRKQQEEIAATRGWIDPEVRTLVDEQLTLEKQLRAARSSLVDPPLPVAPPPTDAPPQSSGPPARPSRVSQITPPIDWSLAPATTAPIAEPLSNGPDQAGPLAQLHREAESLAKSHEEMRRRWKLAVDEKQRISRALDDGPRMVARISESPRIETQLGGPGAKTRLLWITLMSLVVGACCSTFAGSGEEASRLQSTDEAVSWLRLPIWGELHFGEPPTGAVPAPLWVWLGVRASELILMAVVVVLLTSICMQSAFAQQMLKDPLAAYSEAVSLVLGSKPGA